MRARALSTRRSLGARCLACEPHLLVSSAPPCNSCSPLLPLQALVLDAPVVTFFIATKNHHCDLVSGGTQQVAVLTVAMRCS